MYVILKMPYSTNIGLDIYFKITNLNQTFTISHDKVFLFICITFLFRMCTNCKKINLFLSKIYLITMLNAHTYLRNYKVMIHGENNERHKSQKKEMRNALIC